MDGLFTPSMFIMITAILYYLCYPFNKIISLDIYRNNKAIQNRNHRINKMDQENVRLNIMSSTFARPEKPGHLQSNLTKIY